MSHGQAKTILVSLAALYAMALTLLAPRIESFGSESLIETLGWASAGLIFASLSLLALWAVHGRERAWVRWSTATWLLSVFFLAVLYGELRNYGSGDPQIILLAVAAWFTAYVAVVAPLWLLRAVRGWRLQQIESNDAGRDLQARQRQFTIRTLLIATSAAAVFCAALRWVTPYLGSDGDEWPAQMIGGVLIEGTLLGLVVAAGSLPVLSAAWIVLAHGRRPILRWSLGAITAIGIPAGTAMFAWCFNVDEMEIITAALMIELGVLLSGLFAASLVRACGYRLVRQPRGEPPITPVLFQSLIDGHKAVAGAEPRERRNPVQNAHFAAMPRSATTGASLAGNASSPEPHRSRPALPQPLSASPHSTTDRTLDAPHDKRRTQRFACVLAMLAIVALLLACSLPHKLEVWRQADELQRWLALGWNAKFNEDGQITSLTSLGPQDLGGSEMLLAQAPHLESLDFSNGLLTDAQFRQYPIHCPALAQLQWLRLDGTQVGDEAVGCIEKAFPNLKHLGLSRTKVTKAGVSRLGALSALQTLDLADTDVLLEDVPPLPRLESLNLEGTAVDDARLSHLDRFPRLSELNLNRTNSTDGAVAVLAGFPHLRTIDLRLTAVSERGFRELCQALPEGTLSAGASDEMLNTALYSHVRRQSGRRSFAIATSPRSIKRLHARGNHRSTRAGDLARIPGAKTVTDAGLSKLSIKTQMEELDLRDSGVTDAGLASLAPLTSLKRLDLRGTRVTAGGCEQLAKSLPDCAILR